jgi:hypothetical protein
MILGLATFAMICLSLGALLIPQRRDDFAKLMWVVVGVLAVETACEAWQQLK